MNARVFISAACFLSCCTVAFAQDLFSQIQALEAEQYDRSAKIWVLKREIQTLQNRLGSGTWSFTEVRGEKKLPGNEPFPQMRGIKINRVWDRFQGKMILIREADYEAPLADVPWQGGGLIRKEYVYTHLPGSEKRNQLLEERDEKRKEFYLESSLFQMKALLWLKMRNNLQQQIWNGKYKSPY